MSTEQGGGSYLSTSGAAVENKWSRNGFGQPVQRDVGKFSRDESETVRRAVEEYCAVKQITTARLCSECDHKAELKGAWMEIAKSIPHRTVQSVYRHGLRQLHPFKRGPWSEQEVEMLHELIARMGKKWSAIQTKLNRSADSCRDKYREMSNEYTKGRWKDGETECLKRLIREHLRADPNADIKELGRMVEEQSISIPWTAISKKMGKRSRLSCFKKWQKLTGIQSPLEGAVGGDAPQAPKDPPQSQPSKENDKVTAATASSNTTTAAAAAAAGAVVAAAAAAPAAPGQVGDFGNANEEDLDVFLLTEVINQGKDPPDWSVFHMIPNAEERWSQLFNEWQQEEEDVSAEEYTFFDIAQILLERKQRSGDAKLAAATVEAVDLPAVTLTSETREV